MPRRRTVPVLDHLSKLNSGSSANDGSLTLGEPAPAARAAHLSLPSVPTVTDLPTTGLLGDLGGALP